MRMSCTDIKTGAAPATVSGELLSPTPLAPNGAGKARQPHRPASQETCPDELVTSMGGVSHGCACSAKGGTPACVRPVIPQLRIGEIMLVRIESNSSRSGRPESVFVSWLLWQPCGADLQTEALKELRKLARYADRDPDIVRLRSLFTALAGQTGKPH